MLNKQYISSVNDGLLEEPGVLALVLFEPNCTEPREPGIIPVGLQALTGSNAEVIYYGESPATRGIEGQCHWSVIEDVCCIATWIDPDDCEDIALASASAYERLHRVSRQMGFPHVFRAWNFMPNINSGEGDCEIYKQFCLGRHHAFSKLSFEQQDYPAASALGHSCDGAVIYMLASRNVGEQLENPRQRSAYKYPREYGPSSPSFARATVIDLSGDQHVFVSGTASIIGHETVATGNIEEQLSTTIENIQALIVQKGMSLRDLSLVRVYLRRSADFEYTAGFLKNWFSTDQLCILISDICRTNLLVEIEAVALAVK